MSPKATQTACTHSCARAAFLGTAGRHPSPPGPGLGRGGLSSEHQRLCLAGALPRPAWLAGWPFCSDIRPLVRPYICRALLPVPQTRAAPFLLAPPSVQITTSLGGEGDGPSQCARCPVPAAGLAGSRLQSRWAAGSAEAQAQRPLRPSQARGCSLQEGLPWSGSAGCPSATPAPLRSPWLQKHPGLLPEDRTRALRSLRLGFGGGFLLGFPE